MGDAALDLSYRLDLRVLHFRSNPARDEPAMLAQELMGKERYQEAVDLTRAALDVDPDDGDLLLMHGIALSRVGKPKLAQLALMRAVAEDREWVEPWRHLARVLLERERPEQALAVAQRALKLDADDPIAQGVHRDADLLVRGVRYTEGVTDEEPALLASQLLAIGRPDEAFEVTRAALLDEIDDEDLLMVHARAALAREDFDEVLSVLSTARTMSPDWAEPYFMLAQVHELRGDMAAARDAAREGLCLEPEHAELQRLILRLG